MLARLEPGSLGALPPSLGDTASGVVPHPIADWEEFVQFAATQPEIFAFTVAGDPWVFVANPNVVAEALKRPFAEVGMGPFTEALTTAGGSGSGIVTNYQPSWRPRRAIIQRPLTFRGVRDFAAIMAGRSTERVQSWADGAIIDVESEMASLSLDILVESLFSTDVDLAKPLILEFEQARQADVVAATENPGFGRARANHLQAMLENLDEMIYQMIERRRSREPDDLLGALVHGRDESGAPLDDETIRAEAVSLFFAGHSTTALTLTFALILLAMNPEQYARLRIDVSSTLSSELPSADDLKNIPLARAIVEETLRLYPVSDIIDRRTLVDLELAGVPVPAGTALIFSAWLAHRDARYFPEPSRFDPDRFLPPRRREIPADAYFPFGDGPHICVGSHFSLLEASFALVAIAQECDLELVSAAPPLLDHHSLLRPRERVQARIRKEHRH